MEDINKDFVFNHFTRKSSPLQRELIAKWLRDKTNEERYYEWLEEWENNHPQYITQTEPANQRYRIFLAQNPHTDEPAQPSSLPLIQQHWPRRQWLFAASVLLALGLYSFLMRYQLFYQTYETSFGEIRAYKLADGSDVTLNANSSLRVPRWGFGKKTREVFLTGEANFTVSHLSDNQKFIVKTDRNFEVVVLGTEFTVFARKRGSKITLNKGQVRLQYREGSTSRQLLMKPGQLATLDQANHVALNAIEHPEAQSAWREKRFVFNETPLLEVASMLEESYGLQVSIRDPELAQRVLAGSLRADNADQLLQSISELLDINVIRQGNRVQLLSH